MVGTGQLCPVGDNLDFWGNQKHNKGLSKKFPKIGTECVYSKTLQKHN